MPAYGFFFPELEQSDFMRVEGALQWPSINVRVFSNTSAPESTNQDNQAIRPLNLDTGQVEMIKGPPAKALFYLKENIPLSEFIHPNLQLVASTFAQWLGQDIFHAGGVIINGKLWGLLGDRGAGKSTLLAELYLNSGYDVFSDDLLVFREQSVCAGPRIIGLRPDSIKQLTGKNDLNYLQLPSIYSEYPIHGWFVLSWSNSLNCRRLTPKELTYELSRHYLNRNVSKNSYPEYLTSLPAWKVSRPRLWSHSNNALGTILECASAEK